MLTEMQNGSAFDSTEKVTRTEMVNKLLSAKECVMSIKFHKKVDEAWVKQCIQESITSAKSLKDEKAVKATVKQLLAGKDTEMVCCMTGSDGNLGRSSILDLNAPDGKNFRQVDHRTLQELVLQNKKYILK